MKLFAYVRAMLIRLKYSVGKNKIAKLGYNVSLPWKMVIGGGCPKTPFLIFEAFVLKPIMLKHKT